MLRNRIGALAASTTCVGVEIEAGALAALSCDALAPQHQTSPLPARAQTWRPPAVTSTIPDRESTRTGVSFSPMVSPWPAWPTELSPQHQTSPVVVTPHVNQSP